MAEISAIFSLDKNQNGLIASNSFILQTEDKIEPAKIIKTMGGVIKIGLIADETDFNNQAITEKIKNLMDEKEKIGKFKYGISYYGKKRINLKIFGMEIKKYLKEKNIPCRWVTSREINLSSVVVEQNKLTFPGIEIVLIQNNEKILIGRTLAVQPFKELSFRDYGRPARDDYAGMLPPKLAQIMINLAANSDSAETGSSRSDIFILDPFCGSGTILTEALLMGYKNLIGSDISSQAVEDTKKNIEWIKTQFHISGPAINIKNQNATELSKFIKPQSIDAIITEPYLGPSRGKTDFKKIVPKLEQLYAKSLSEFKKILKPGGKIVMIWPVSLKSDAAHYLCLNLSGFKIVNPIPPDWRENKIIKLTPRKTIIYGREKQKIWREIIILEK